MSVETFTNQPTGTVTSGGTTTGSTSFTVTATNAFPVASTSTIPATTFNIMDPALPTEIMTVTTAPGGTGAGQAWTVTRGAEGTMAVAHAASWTCVQVISAGSLQGFKQASGASTTAVTITTSTTETVLASHQPQAADLVAGTTWEAVAFGPVTAHGGSTRGTLGFNLYWGGSGSIGGAYTLGTGKLLASLVTNANMPPFAATTVIAGASFDVEGAVTWLTATTAHANLNAWLSAGAALNTVPLTGSATNTTSAGGASSATAITIPNNTPPGPIFLTAVWTANYTAYGLTAVAPVIYRMA